MKKITRRELRESKNLSMREVAKRAGVGLGTVWNYEHGLSNNKKLDKFFQGIKEMNDRGIMELYGFNQKQLSKMTNVSEATVSRYMRGKTHNKVLDNALLNLKKNYQYMEEYRSIRDKALDKMKKLENWGAFGPAYNKMMAEGGLTEDDILTGDTNKLKIEIGRLRKWDNYQTSTVSGYEDWISNVETSSKNTSQAKDWAENVSFWKVFNRLKGNRTISRYWGGGRFDSEQAINDIQAVMHGGVKFAYNVDTTNAEDVYQAVLRYIKEL